ncbi:hypothetical protein NKG94_08650 [Micromonospora sp. M12]
MDASGQVLAAVLADHAGGWALPRAAAAVVDADYVLAAGACSPRNIRRPRGRCCVTICAPIETRRPDTPCRNTRQAGCGLTSDGVGTYRL